MNYKKKSFLNRTQILIFMTFHGNISTKTLTNNILTITTYLNVGVIDFQTITRKMSHILKYVIGIEANFFSKNIKSIKNTF